MTICTVNMRLVKQTRGALKYVEIDEEGNELDMREGKVGQLYIRKSNFNAGDSYPQQITVKIDRWVG